MNIREKLKDKKRIVIKIGSSSLTHKETGRLDLLNWKYWFGSWQTYTIRGRKSLWCLPAPLP